MALGQRHVRAVEPAGGADHVVELADVDLVGEVVERLLLLALDREVVELVARELAFGVLDQRRVELARHPLADVHVALVAVSVGVVARVEVEHLHATVSRSVGGLACSRPWRTLASIGTATGVALAATATW